MKCENRFLIIEYNVLQNKHLSLAERLIYAYVLSYYRGAPKDSFVKSNNFIAEELGLSKSKVVRAIDSLERLQLIKCKYAKSQGVHSNRVIEIVKEEPKDIDVVKLFNKVYPMIKR